MKCPKSWRLVLLFITFGGAESFLSASLDQLPSRRASSEVTTGDEHRNSIPWKDAVEHVSESPGYRTTPAQLQETSPDAFIERTKPFSFFMVQNTGAVPQSAHS